MSCEPTGLPVTFCGTLQIGRLIVQINVTLVFNIAPADGGGGAPSVGKTNFDGKVGVVFDDDLAITGGVPPYTVDLDPAAMPPGLSINSQGHVAGTPTAAGTYTVVAAVGDQQP